MQSGDTHPMSCLMSCTAEDANWCLMWDRRERRLVTCSYQATQRQKGFPAPCTAYLRGDPMREVGGVGLLPALCRRRTACRRNVLRSRRNMTVSSLPGAVMVRDIIGQSDWIGFFFFFFERELCVDTCMR